MKAFGISDKGAVRKENQDSFRFVLSETEDTLCAVLCDGMGGALSGSVASAMAVDTFMSHAGNSLDSSSSPADMRQILKEAVNYANIKVYDRSFADFSCMGMGCTLVAMLVNGRRCLLANVGDSRAYILSKGAIAQVTKDHSLVEEMVEKGEISAEEARTHPRRNIITRAIGVEAGVRTDIFDLKLSPGTRILLCSDGLSNLVTDNEILSISEGCPDLDKAASMMMELALRRGAPDNVTVFIAER